MTTSQSIKKTVKQPIASIAVNLEKNLDAGGWTVSYSDRFTLKNGETIYELFGVSPSFAGSTILSLLRQGARNVSFFIRLRSIKKETEIMAISGGSESFFQTDWGRNKKIVEILLEFCTKKPKIKM